MKARPDDAGGWREDALCVINGSDPYRIRRTIQRDFCNGNAFFVYR